MSLLFLLNMTIDMLECRIIKSDFHIAYFSLLSALSCIGVAREEASS